jgi:large repetitive protein
MMNQFNLLITALVSVFSFQSVLAQEPEVSITFSCGYASVVNEDTQVASLDTGIVSVQGQVFEAKDSTFCQLLNFSFHVLVAGTTASGQNIDTVVSVTTDQSGNYLASSYDSGSQITSLPSKTDELLRGVDVLDAVALSDHLLGVKRLPNLYRQIAADVNNTRSITSNDLMSLSKVILATDSAFIAPSYFFMDKNFVFPNPNNPFPMPFNSAVSSLPVQSLVAIKMGDVTDPLNCDASTFVPDTTYIYLTDQDLVPNQTFEVEMAFPSDLIGFQGTIFFPGLEILDIIPLNNNPSQFAQFPTSNQVTFLNYRTNSPNFRLKFKAISAGKLSDFLLLNSGRTKNVCYLDDREQRVLLLKFLSSSTTNLTSSALKMAIAPNPFSQEAVVQFYLPKAEKVEVRVFDMLGKQVYQAAGQTYAQGTNTARLQAADLGQNGAYQVILSTETSQQTKALILQR